MKKKILLFLKGVAMGASDVVPGVSGGTIAFITGIYERLIHAIQSFNLKSLKLLFKGEFKAVWENIDGTFLVVLIAGILTSILSLAKLITHLLEAQPTYIWSFFFGLIIASTLFIARGVKWNWKSSLFFVGFTILSFFITSPSLHPLAANGSLLNVFISGAIAICAMILPGISGSFILLLLGQYEFILGSVIDLNLPVLLTFALGAVIGIISFSHLLNWLFERYENMTLAALTGFMLGSLNKVWPWKNTLESYINHHGIERPLVQENRLPDLTPSLYYALGLIALGLVLIFVIEGLSKRLNKK